MGRSNGFSATSASCSAFSALKKSQQIFNAESAESFAESGEKNSDSSRSTTEMSLKASRCIRGNRRVAEVWKKVAKNHCTKRKKTRFQTVILRYQNSHIVANKLILACFCIKKTPRSLEAFS